MKILFCGTMVPDEIEYQVQDISAAGNRFQNNMIKNLEQSGHVVQQCSFLGVPISQEIKEKLGHGSDKGKSYVFKEKNILKSIRTYKRLVKQLMNDIDIVICYNVVYAWLFLPCWAKKRKKKSIVVLADYSASVSYKSIAGKLYAGFQLWSMRQFRTVVGLSANIARKVKKSQQFVLMEGGIDQAFYDAFTYRPHQAERPICFMYSGLLSPVTGVDMLLQAMDLIENTHIRLVISGKGPLEEVVREAALRDSRICYKGHLIYEEYIEQLQNADVLLNPRNMHLPENQNNFPSKIMDYLAAGKLIVSTKFVGWEKFVENIKFIETDAVQLADSMADCLMVIISQEMSRNNFERNRGKAEEYLWKSQLIKMLSEYL